MPRVPCLQHTLHIGKCQNQRDNITHAVETVTHGPSDKRKRSHVQAHHTRSQGTTRSNSNPIIPIESLLRLLCVCVQLSSSGRELCRAHWPWRRSRRVCLVHPGLYQCETSAVWQPHPSH
eukprot:1437788-Amphidinium_carterae.1